MTLVLKDKLETYGKKEGEKLEYKTPIEAARQQYREIHIGILNLMPTDFWPQVEREWLHHLEDDNIQVVPHFIAVEGNARHNPKRDKRISEYYESIDDVKSQGLDGLIVTGANIKGGLEDASFREEFLEISKWASEKVSSTIYSCWAAHAGLEANYNIKKTLQDNKTWGVIDHYLEGNFDKLHPLLKGLDDNPRIIHSRHNKIDRELLEEENDLNVLVDSDEGWGVAVGRKGREVYLQGHLEYERDHLYQEHMRDIASGKIPSNYYRNGLEGEQKGIINSWLANSNLFFRNWVNFVYQNTNYDRLKALEEEDVKL